MYGIILEGLFVLFLISNFKKAQPETPGPCVVPQRSLDRNHNLIKYFVRSLGIYLMKLWFLNRNNRIHTYRIFIHHTAIP